MITNVIVLTAGALLLGPLFRRWMQRSDAGVRSSLDREIDEVMIQELARRLPAEERDLRSAFEGRMVPGLQERIARRVRGVEISFRRLASSRHELEILLSLDTTRIRHTREIEREQIPDVIRAELLRSGASSVTVPWNFPWQEAPLAEVQR